MLPITDKAKYRLKQISHSLADDPDAFHQFWTYDEYWSKLRKAHTTDELKNDRGASSIDTYVATLTSFKKELTEVCAVKSESFGHLLNALMPSVRELAEVEGERSVDSVEDLFHTYLRAELKNVIPIDRRKVRMEHDGQVIWAGAARMDESCIMAAGYPERVLMNLEMYTAQDEDRDWLVEQYAETIRSSDIDGQPVTTLCFVEKPFGGAGALAIRDEIMHRLPGLDTLLLSTDHRPSVIRGKPPTPHSNVAIIYDLIYTGGGVIETGQALYRLFGTERITAIVLYDYGFAPDDLTPLRSSTSILHDTAPLQKGDLVEVVEDRVMEDHVLTDSKARLDQHEWLLEHWKEFETKYRNKWIAIGGRRVLGSGSSSEEALQEARSQTIRGTDKEIDLICMTDTRTLSAGPNL